MKLEKVRAVPANAFTPLDEPDRLPLMVLPFLKPWKSLHAEWAGYFKDPRLQLAFTFQSKYLGVSPFQCPSLFSILSFLEYEYGIWHPTGGCNAITSNMARVTQEPPGHSALYVLLPVTHQHPNVDWNQERARYRGVALRQLEKLGVTDIEKRIRFERVVTPADWEGKLDIYRGATFNLAHSFAQMLHLRPQNRFEEFDRMYLVGGGTHPGSGLPVIFESARISSKLLLEDLN